MWFRTPGSNIPYGQETRMLWCFFVWIKQTRHHALISLFCCLHIDRADVRVVWIFSPNSTKAETKQKASPTILASTCPSL